MKVHQLLQGSPEWLAHRREHFNASDAPAMMGCSPYKTRAQLLREMHTGVAADADAGQQKRFDNGHRAEALARPLAEKIIGEDLYPVTGSDGRLSASFDGLTLAEIEGFEHKALNAALKAAFAAIDALGPHDDAEPGRLLPIYHRVQMEQQLRVSGAERILFMASEWTAEGEMIEERHCWYYPDAELRASVLRGWEQFERDLATYALPESAEPAPTGKAPETLPALRIEVTGMVTASNLAEFKETALAAIRSVNRSLTTDQDFADAERAVKWCGDVESRLAAAKEHALSQTASIDALFKAIDDIAIEARRVRLDLDKLVTRRKSEVKEEAVASARAALDQHVRALNAEMAPMQLTTATANADFVGAIKGLRSVASMQDALDRVLAAAKIAADVAARGIRANVAAFEQDASGLEFLFSDLGQLVHKAADDFKATMQARIAAHRAAEDEKARKRKEAEDARIAAAEQRAREQEAARIAAEARAAAQRQADEAARAAAAAARAEPPTTLQVAADIIMQKVAAPPAMPPVSALAKPMRADEPATLKLGAICGRLGITMTAAFVADSLLIKPARIDGAARLYRESDFGRICAALQQHIERARQARHERSELPA